MRGQQIIARTLSIPAVADKFGNRWQYHSRSDRHSKVACWAILFDLLQSSSLLQQHVEAGKVTFGINRQLNDWETGKKKDLDLVVARASSSEAHGVSNSFDLNTLAEQYELDLTEGDREVLAELPVAPSGRAGSTVLIALEAKACMTAHIKALPRLYDELTSSHSIVHGDSHNALSVGFVMVNHAETFLSPGRNQRALADYPADVSMHRQPHDTKRTLDKLQEIRRRGGSSAAGGGFDAMGIMLVTMTNDGSPVTVVTDPPAPEPSSSYHYDQMISRAAHRYDSNFGHLT